MTLSTVDSRPSASVWPAAPKRVVVLDDDLAMLRALERLLAKAGFSVMATHDPRRAFESLVCDGADVVVSDLYMPDMGGNVVLAMLAKAAPTTSRVLLTGENDFGNVAALSVPCSVDVFLPKRDASLRLVPTLRHLVTHRAQNDGDMSADEARSAARGMIRALARIEDAAHCDRVAAWACRIGQECGLRGPELFDLELGALLHDIGEVGVREAVLEKPGPLTDAEWEQVRRHPDLGAVMLTDLAVLRRGIDVVRSHHERIDGHGYPRGLRGNAIPLAARIFQVADAYDAIHNGRSYRAARTDSEARLEIAAHVGSQFDPDIHHAFTRIDRDDWQSVVAHIR